MVERVVDVIGIAAKYWGRVWEQSAERILHSVSSMMIINANNLF